MRVNALDLHGPQKSLENNDAFGFRSWISCLGRREKAVDPLSQGLPLLPGRCLRVRSSLSFST